MTEFEEKVCNDLEYMRGRVDRLHEKIDKQIIPLFQTVGENKERSATNSKILIAAVLAIVVGFVTGCAPAPTGYGDLVATDPPSPLADGQGGGGMSEGCEYDLDSNQWVCALSCPECLACPVCPTAEPTSPPTPTDTPEPTPTMLGTPTPGPTPYPRIIGTTHAYQYTMSVRRCDGERSPYWRNDVNPVRECPRIDYLSYGEFKGFYRFGSYWPEGVGEGKPRDVWVALDMWLTEWVAICWRNGVQFLNAYYNIMPRDFIDLLVRDMLPVPYDCTKSPKG